jgi:hypothetical protein
VTADEFGEVDFDLLADYVGGALDGTPEHATVAALIASEPAWRDAHDELARGMAAVGAALGALGTTAEPMPAEVATRLAEAFAAAGPAADDEELGSPGRRHLSPVPAGAPEERASVRKRGPEKRGRRLRWAAPIAVAAAAVAFVGFGLDYLAGRSPDVTSDSAASGGASSGAGRAENAPMLATDQAPAAAGVAGLPPAGEIRSTGTDYLPTTLAKAGTNDARKLAPAPGGVATDTAADPLARLRPGAGLQACLQAIADAHGAGAITVQSLDYARFTGTPALVVRFTAADGTWAWASGATCGSPGTGAATLGSAKVG